MDQIRVIKDFLRSIVGPFQSIQPIQHDASTRRYFRVQTSDDGYILCYDENAKHATPENYTFLIVYNLLQKYAVPVPEIFTIDFKQGFILQQDLGNQLLEQSLLNFSEKEKKDSYQACLDILMTIQKIEFDGSIPFHLAFDLEKLLFEFDFFIEHGLQGYFHAGISDDSMQNIRKSFVTIAELLQREDAFVLNHRDFHCRNIMLVGNKPFIIDFQDARMGLPQYDLVSILRDPYSQLEDQVFSYLYEYYFEESKDLKVHSFGRDEFDYYFDIMAFQRLIKAIGTYGYQTTAKGSDRYSMNIDVAFAYLNDIIEKHAVLKQCWSSFSGYVHL